MHFFLFKVGHYFQCRHDYQNVPIQPRRNSLYFSINFGVNLVRVG